MLKEIKTSSHHGFEDEHGRLQGEYKEWYKNGKLRGQCVYVDNKMNGEYTTWYDNGQQLIHTYYANDKKHGEYMEWCDNGNLFLHCFYVNGIFTPFRDLPYPVTPEDRLYFTLKYDLPLLPVVIC